MWDNGEFVTHPIMNPVPIVDNYTQVELYRSLNAANIPPENNWNEDFTPQEVAMNSEEMNTIDFGQMATERDVSTTEQASTLTFGEDPITSQEPTVSDVSNEFVPTEETAKTFNWDLVWNPAQCFATDSQATIEDLAQTAGSIPISEVTSDMVEATAVTADIASGGIAIAGQAIASALSGLTTAITGNRIQDTNIQAQQTYNNAMNNGHGIGFQNVAQNNLMNSYSASANFKGYADTMTSLLGPFGGLIAAMSPMDTPTVDTTFMANTASGEEVNAQDENTIETASA